jgi:hypothetical protein
MLDDQYIDKRLYFASIWLVKGRYKPTVQAVGRKLVTAMTSNLVLRGENEQQALFHSSRGIDGP